MRICIGLFFLSLTGVLLWNAQDIRHIVKGLSQRVDPIASNLEQSTKNLADATSNAKDATKAITAAVNGKHGVKEVLLNVDKLTADIRQTSITTMHAAEVEKADIHEAMQAVISGVRNVDVKVSTNLDTMNADLGSLGTALKRIGGDDGLIASSTLAVQAVQHTLANEQIAKIQDQFLQTSINVTRTTTEAKEAVGYIRDALRPTKRTFLGLVEKAAFGTIPELLIHLFMRKIPQDVTVKNK